MLLTLYSVCENVLHYSTEIEEVRAAIRDGLKGCLVNQTLDTHSANSKQITALYSQLLLCKYHLPRQRWCSICLHDSLLVSF